MFSFCLKSASRLRLSLYLAHSLRQPSTPLVSDLSIELIANVFAATKMSALKMSSLALVVRHRNLCVRGTLPFAQIFIYNINI